MLANQLRALAKGLHPITQNPLSGLEELKQPEVQTLLKEAADALVNVKPKNKLSEKELAERDAQKRTKNIEQGLPARSGFAWTEQEIQWLTATLAAGKVACSVLVKKIQRKETAIISKCIAMGLIKDWSQVEKHIEVSAEIKEIIHKRAVEGTKTWPT